MDNTDPTSEVTVPPTPTPDTPQVDQPSTDPKVSNNKKPYNFSHQFGKKRSYLLPAIIFAILVAAMGGIMLYFQGSGSSDIRSRASNTGSVLGITPDTKEASVGDTIPLAITLNTGTDTVSAVELHLSFDATAIQIVSFALPTNPPLPNTISAESVANGVVSVVLGSPTSGAFTGSDIIGTLTVKLIAAKNSTIDFTSATQVAVIGKTTNALASVTGTTINGAPNTTLTPTPTLPSNTSPTPTSIPPTPTPTTETKITPTPTSAPNTTATPTPTATSSFGSIVATPTSTPLIQSQRTSKTYRSNNTVTPTQTIPNYITQPQNSPMPFYTPAPPSPIPTLRPATGIVGFFQTIFQTILHVIRGY